jgi:hypothetical protein
VWQILRQRIQSTSDYTGVIARTMSGLGRWCDVGWPGTDRSGLRLPLEDGGASGPDAVAGNWCVFGRGASIRRHQALQLLRPVLNHDDARRRRRILNSLDHEEALPVGRDIVGARAADVAKVVLGVDGSCRRSR